MKLSFAAAMGIYAIQMEQLTPLDPVERRHPTQCWLLLTPLYWLFVQGLPLSLAEFHKELAYRLHQQHCTSRCTALGIRLPIRTTDNKINLG